MGWGGEDTNLYAMLQYNKINKLSFSSSFIEEIEHSDEERQFEETDSVNKAKGQAHKTHSMYSRIKQDFMLLNGYPPLLKDRKDLMQKIKNEMKNENSTAKVEITFPPQGPYKLHKKIIYTMD